ncbi:translocation/assembly module TamB domain-containing protein [Marinobacter sp. AL4B]|uniref:translocation/assembly module TamB domain-containing protein n=1 Tax=Marinobacter sp. AL4B TaxID=2871173 RepID=UPI0029351ACB|nr:translocation/assembly module TamB domain-containing protein [Marinobacter sp. AL4B]
MSDQPEATDNPKSGMAKETPRRRWWFWLLVLLAVALLLPLVLLGLVLVALNTDKGTAWTLEKIPGLHTEAAYGSLLGQWQAERLEWQGYGVGVDVQSPEVDWSPTCLFELTVCLDALKASRIDVTVQPSDTEEQSSGGISLPDITLPLAVNVKDVALGELTVNGSRIWDLFSLKTSGSGASLDIDQASYVLGDLRVNASGWVEMRRDWPLDLNVKVDLPPPSGDQWTVDLKLAGSVRDLRVDGQSTGYLEANLQGTAKPLDERLPAQLKLTSPAFMAHHTLPSTLLLQDLVLSLGGSLAKGFQTEARAVLPGTTGNVQLGLDGLVTTEAASDLHLSLSGPAVIDRADPGTFNASGNLSWKEGLQANADISLDAFPWFGLLPDVSEPPVVLETLMGQASYQGDNYKANLEASVKGPQGTADLVASLEGDSDALIVDRLDMKTGAGSLTAQAELGLTGPLSWQAALELNAFNPGYWLPVLEADLNGQVISQGHMQDSGLPVMTADWDLAGEWQQQPAKAEGKLSSDGADWTLKDLLVSVAENEVTGSGRYGTEIGADLSVMLPKPELIVPGLQGELSGDLSARGSLEDPQGQIRLNADQLAWRDEAQVGRLEIQASLGSGEVLDANIMARAIKAADQVLDEVNVSAQGTRGQHQLSLEAKHPDVSLLMELAGGLGEAFTSWSGAITRGEINVPEPGHLWELDQRTALSYSNQGVLELGQHCWRWQDSSVCAEDQQLWPNPAVAYRINQFPTLALEPLLPDTFRWKALLNANIEVAMTDAGPDGRVEVDAGEGTFEFLVLDDWEKLSHQQLTLNAILKPELAELSMLLKGPELGQFSTQLSVDPVSADRSVDGTFSLKKLDLAFVSAFSGIDEVAGQVNGEGRLDGPLLKPAVTGELALTEGRFQDPDLPLPMEDVVLAVEFSGYNADISGRWQSNDRSEGQLSGSLDWRDEPELNLNVKGERLPVHFEPYASVEAGPDINIRFRPGELSVSGRVEVPRGRIEVQSLPESAVSVSSDEVIVGAEAEEPAIRTMLMDVVVVVGEDEVTLDAFGLTGDLKGTLRIGNDMDTRGALQLVNGRYEAYGQDLDLRRARVVFVGALAEPYLDIEAVREVDTVVAGIRLSGPISEPETEVFSEPSMPQSEALSYVILGRPPQGRGDEGQMSAAAISLGLTQTNDLTQSIGDELGIKNLMLEAEGSGETASVVASGYITDELSIRYGVGIFEPITTVALRYDLGRYFYLEAASGLAASLDIFYTRDF